MYTVKKKWLTGWVCLPCFTVKVLDGKDDYGADLTCNAVLSEIFLTFFAPFWGGKVHITGSYEEGTFLTVLRLVLFVLVYLGVGVGCAITIL